jgi:hypothetical protein
MQKDYPLADAHLIGYNNMRQPERRSNEARKVTAPKTGRSDFARFFFKSFKPP